MPKGNEESTDRSAGGPGSSHQGGSHGHAHREKGHTQPGAATNSSKSQVSGGGGERDSHHTHDEHRKGDRSGY
ncbi:hypothetical protein D9599_13845 [Roseomonas sp. KE2513]|uniref:hypothetical protein n=1 Tax=Roseomonas sp. KE2513 TaxID=2479202 RepID=UPI0018E05A4D|nr:hypothetical protein [Roseomonas sp. KE2513]MBI0536660.1 hypothetical protein [Roseomonas sp. KE2513]